MPDQVDVSVLIPVLNEEAHLRAASDAMLAQDFPGRAEFLFIDGGSEDASAAILGELAASDDRVRVLANPARRTPQALNIGLRAARGTFIARMDAHTLYPPRYLASGVERLRRDDCAWVSGPQLAVGVDPGSRLVARALGAALGKGGARFRDALEREHEVDSGFTGMWRRETLERHHGWDEEWLNDQDLELAARDPQGRRPDRVHSGDGRGVRAAQQPAGAVEAVPDLRDLSGQDRTAPPRDVAALPAAAPAGDGHRRLGRSPHRASACARWRAGGSRSTGPRWRSRPRAPPPAVRAPTSPRCPACGRSCTSATARASSGAARATARRWRR